MALYQVKVTIHTSYLIDAPGDKEARLGGEAQLIKEIQGEVEGEGYSVDTEARFLTARSQVIMVDRPARVVDGSSGSR